MERNVFALGTVKLVETLKPCGVKANRIYKMTNTQKFAKQELDILADTPFDDYVGLYVEPLQSVERHLIEEPNWRELKRAAASERIVDENGIPVLGGGFEDADRPRESARKLTRFNPQ